MATYFFPSCKATAQFRQASKDARAYVKEKLGVAPIGCCRPNHKKLTAYMRLAYSPFSEQWQGPAK